MDSLTTKIFNSFVFSLCVLAIIGCSKPAEIAKEKPDSVHLILKHHASLVQERQKAEQILDSIDHFLNNERKGQVSSVNNRLSNLFSQIKTTEQKLKKAEKQLKIARNEASAYEMMADAYKSEVEIRDEQIRSMEDSVSVKQTAFVKESEMGEERR